MSKQKPYLISVIAVVLILGGVILSLWFTAPQKVEPVLRSAKERVIISSVDDYESRVAAGYLLLTTYPSKCLGPDGKIFTRSTTLEIEME